VLTAARGIADVVDAAMGAAVRLVTVARGIDPRRLTLVGFGGAGPTHVLALAEQFGVRRVAVPSMAGVMSAVGLISADIVHDVARSVRQLSSSVEGSDILEAIAELETVAGQAVTAQAPGAALTLHRSVDMRYRHQAHDVSVPLVEGGPDEILAAMEVDFRQIHKRRYGVESNDPVEIVGFVCVQLASCRGSRSRRAAQRQLAPQMFKESDGFNFVVTPPPTHRFTWRTKLVLQIGFLVRRSSRPGTHAWPYRPDGRSRATVKGVLRPFASTPRWRRPNEGD